MKQLFRLFFLLLFFSSSTGCLIKQEIHFNEDFSGTYSFILDFSALNEMSKNDSTKTDSDKLTGSFTELDSEIKNINGISNSKIISDTVNGSVAIQFDFANPEALNKALKHTSSIDLQGNEDNKAMEFIKKKNKLIVSQQKPKQPNDSQSEVMNEMLKYELIISFDKKIKSAKLNPAGSFDSSGNKASIKGKMYSLLDKNLKWKFKFEK